jgi:hypothetical protein
MAVASMAAAGAVAAVALSSGQRGETPEAALVETWIQAWNDRDAQAVSAMTCDYRPAFVPGSVIETYLAEVPGDRPPVADHRITGEEPGVAYDHEVVRVRVTYLPASRDSLRETSVFIGVRNDGEMCVGAFTAW